MNLRNFWRKSVITEKQVASVIGEYTWKDFVEEEIRCKNEVIQKLKEYNLAEEIDEEKIQMSLILLNEKATSGNPLLMVVKPWVSRDYSGNIFYVSDGLNRREVCFQPFFDDDKAYEFANKFYGLNSCDEVCKMEEEIREKSDHEVNYF